MTLLSILLLNLLWFASVLGAANLLLWPAAVALLLLLLVTFIYVGFNKHDCKLIMFSLLCGTLIDGVLMSQGLVIYQLKGHELSFIPPLWIMFLWLGFAASIRTGMQWLLNYPVIGGLFMLIGAPLSYLSAAKLGAVTLPNLMQAMTFIGVCWLLYFILIVLLSPRKESGTNALA